MLELFARIEDEERALSVILSDGQVTLEPADGPRIWFSRNAFERLAELVRRYDAAIAAAGGGG